MPADPDMLQTLFVSQFADLKSIPGRDQQGKTSNPEFFQDRFKEGHVWSVIQVNPDLGLRFPAMADRN
jgi:hypothetical protein